MNIYEFVKEKENAYPHAEITLYESKQFNQHKTIRQIDAYCDSHYISGMHDDLGRRKPFYNIVNRILHKQVTAEEIDTKDISLTTTRPMHYAKSFAMTVANRKWMKKANFAHTLNHLIETRGKYGGVLVKKVMKNGIVDLDIVDWSQTITDPVDIENGVKIQRLKMTPAELMAMKGKWQNIEEAIIVGVENQQEHHEYNEVDNNQLELGDYITVYVVDGVMDRKYIDDNANPYEYTQQMHIVVLGEKPDDNKIQGGVTLFSVEDIDNPFKYLPYEKVAGRGLGRGVVEQSFQAQMGMNESAINEKNAMDIASKVIYQAQAGSGLAGNNVLSDVIDGTILEFQENPMVLTNGTPASLGHHQNMRESWKAQVSDQTSVQDVNTGVLPASATFRGIALGNQEANSLFELRREEMGIFLKEIYRDWIIPFLKKWVSDEDFLEAEFSAEELQKIQKDWVQKSADKTIGERIKSGDYDNLPAETKWVVINNEREMEAEKVLSELEGRKFLKMPKGYLKGVEFDLDIVITDEQRIKQVYLEKLINALQMYVENTQTFANDPNAQAMFNQILETADISPLEFSNVPQISQEVVEQTPQLSGDATALAGVQNNVV